MKRSITAISIITAALLLAGCATVGATQSQARDLPWEGFAYAPRDWAASELPQGAVRIAAEQETSSQEQQEAAGDAIDYEAYYDYEPTYYSAWAGAGDGFMQEGVRSGVDSNTETWYSSNVAYLQGTENFHTDDEGYWRDSDGYYVVSSDDYAPDSVVNTSKGEGKVYDNGTSSGNIDMYVAW